MSIQAITTHLAETVYIAPKELTKVVVSVDTPILRPLTNKTTTTTTISSSKSTVVVPDMMEDHLVVPPPLPSHIESDDHSTIMKKGALSSPVETKEIQGKNTLLHQLRLEREGRQIKVIKKKGKKKKVKKDKDPPPLEFEIGMDDEEVLNAAIRSSKHCSFGRSCKENISLFGSVCQFCKLKFCLKHCQQVFNPLLKTIII